MAVLKSKETLMKWLNSCLTSSHFFRKILAEVFQSFVVPGKEEKTEWSVQCRDWGRERVRVMEGETRRPGWK